MKDNTIFLIIGAILIALLLFNQVPKEESMIVVHYYRGGVEVTPSLFSVITPPGGMYDQISFDIVATSDSKITNMQIIDATPIEFKDALPTTTQTLSEETKTLWSSDLIDTASLESYSQPLTFWVSISGFDEFYEEETSDEDSLALTIEPEPEIGDFFYLFDQWYSGSYTTSASNYLLIFESGISPKIRKYDMVGPTTCERQSPSSTICVNTIDHWSNWRPEELRCPITNSFPFKYYGIYTDGTYIWVVTSEVAMPYTRYIVWFDINDNKIGRFDLPLPYQVTPGYGSAEFEIIGMVLANDYIYLGAEDNNILKFTKAGDLIETYPIAPGGRDFAYDGTYFYATYSGGVRVYDTDWNLIDTFLNAIIENPWGIAYDGTNLWVTDSTDDQRIAYKINTY